MDTINNPMNEQPSDLEVVNLTIEKANEHIERFKMLDRLYENKEFKAIVIEGLFKDESVALVRALAFPGNTEEASQRLIMQRLSMISELQMYFNQIAQEGRAASAAIKAHEVTRDEILEEQADQA